jgi:acyl-CoA thioesterase FadM
MSVARGAVLQLCTTLHTRRPVRFEGSLKAYHAPVENTLSSKARG